MISQAASDVLKAFDTRKAMPAASYAEVLKNRAAWENATPALPADSWQSFANGLRYLRHVGRLHDRAIIYFHGGGFTEGSPRTHYGLTKSLCDATGWDIISLEYSLAPETTYPDTVAEIIPVFRELCGRYQRLMVSGDSAGACLALELLSELPVAERASLAGLVLFSPWLDLSLAKYQGSDREDADPLVSLASLEACAASYANGHDRSRPGLSPGLGSMENLPPTLILVGGTELLMSDAHEFKRRHPGAEISVLVYEGMWHVWVAWTDLPEAQRALGEVAAFCAKYS